MSTILCDTRVVGSSFGKQIVACVVADYSARDGLRIESLAWHGGTCERFLAPSILRSVPTGTREEIQETVRAHAEAWFKRAEQEIWRRAHPDSAPSLPTE